MTNFEAILQMDATKLETFLDHVYLTGLNTGMYAATLEEAEQEAVLDSNFYDMKWLLSEAEDATRLVFAEEGDTYMPQALTMAVLRSAGIDPKVAESLAEEAESAQTGRKGLRVKIGATLTIREGIEDLPDLDQMNVSELQALLEKLQQELAILQSDEPDDDDSDEYEAWEEDIETLEDQISQVEDAIDELDED